MIAKVGRFGDAGLTFGDVLDKQEREVVVKLGWAGT